MSPIIVIDSREKLPLDITAYPTQVATLPVGDYGVWGFSDWDNPQIAVERKSLDDLVGSLTTGRERFFRECLKLRQFQFKALLIEGTREDIEAGRYRSKASTASILGSLTAIQIRHGIHIVFAGNHENAARELERMVRVFCSGLKLDYERLHQPEMEIPR